MKNTEEWHKKASEILDEEPIKAYIVKYSYGAHGEYWEHNVFVTVYKEKAKKWVDKFNKKVEKWKDYINQQRDSRWTDYPLSERYWEVLELNEAFIEEIEIR